MKNRRLLIKKLMVVFFILLAVVGSAQDVKQEFLQRMRATNEETSSIHSNYVQKRTLSIMEDVLISSGEFFYKKPGLMKWDQQQPTAYYFILNGSKVIRFDGQKRKTIPATSPQVAHFKDFIIGTVNGSMFESEQFLSTFTKTGNEVVVILIPEQKAMKKRIDKIQLVFEYDKMILLELVIMEKGDDMTAIYFSNQKFNAITDNAIFN
jgi:outer membrane lipoprotein-sorting protein